MPEGVEFSLHDHICRYMTWDMGSIPLFDIDKLMCQEHGYSPYIYIYDHFLFKTYRQHKKHKRHPSRGPGVLLPADLYIHPLDPFDRRAQTWNDVICHMAE